MYKEKLLGIFVERFVEDKIDLTKFNDLAEKVDLISENRAEEILTEAFDGLYDYTKDIKRISTIGKDSIRLCYSKFGKIGIKKETRELKKKCYLASLNKIIQELQKASIKCSKSKRPDLCKSRYEEAIRQTKKKFALALKTGI